MTAAAAGYGGAVRRRDVAPELRARRGRSAEAGKLFGCGFVFIEFDQIAFLRDDPVPATAVMAAAGRVAYPAGIAAALPVARTAGRASAAGDDFSEKADVRSRTELPYLFPGRQHPAGNLLNEARLPVAAMSGAETGVQNLDQHPIVFECDCGGLRGGQCFRRGGASRRGVSRQGDECRSGNDGKEKYRFFHDWRHSEFESEYFEILSQFQKDWLFPVNNSFSHVPSPS